MNASRQLLAGLALCLAASMAAAQKTETVKIAVIDPLSGPAAVTGVNQFKTAEFFAGVLNRSRSGSEPRYEVFGLDSKRSAAEAVTQVQAAIARGARFIVQGNGSAVALAISEAVARHNEANPGCEVIYANQAAIDPALTNEKCSFWHFRIDADVSMRMDGEHPHVLPAGSAGSAGCSEPGQVQSRLSRRYPVPGPEENQCRHGSSPSQEKT
ncbi:substrate-binding family protein [Variovorax beijingensis]|uniref:Substrate-binding family protein n=1 Tax=Variovorax beijingensis TaxID=2496117 RepID=A0A561BEB8_9BURK|nr:ABC transporter substrate-binding protein [Variovorax beijingensis]TWD77209.1 substrate-binding family protein [Variovorax beijingensis]